MKKALVIYAILLILSYFLFSSEEMAQLGSQFVYFIMLYLTAELIASKLPIKKLEEEEEDLPF